MKGIRLWGLVLCIGQQGSGLGNLLSQSLDSVLQFAQGLDSRLPEATVYGYMMQSINRDSYIGFHWDHIGYIQG